jgi:hypothetical protein
MHLGLILFGFFIFVILALAIRKPAPQGVENFIERIGLTPAVLGLIGGAGVLLYWAVWKLLHV